MKLDIGKIASIAVNIIDKIEEYETALTKLLDLEEYDGEVVKKTIEENELLPAQTLYEKLEFLRKELATVCQPKVEVDENIFKKYIDDKAFK